MQCPSSPVSLYSTRNCHTFGRPMFVNITGYVYFIQAEHSGPIKIGYSRDIKKRLIALRTANPFKLNLVCAFPANQDMEYALHLAFDDIRLEGEWFLPHPDLLREIQTQHAINAKWGFNFKEPNPKIDIVDWSGEAEVENKEEETASVG